MHPDRRTSGPTGRSDCATFAVSAVLLLLIGACTPGGTSPGPSVGRHSPTTTATPTGSRPLPTASVPARSVATSLPPATNLSSPGTDPPQPVVPTTYQQACANEVVCTDNVRGAVPATLIRALHFPAVQPGHPCPATSGGPANTSFFDGTALGTGLVRPLIAMAGDLAHGSVDLDTGEAPGWLAFKTLWFSVPAYQGPFLIRAAPLDGKGVIRMGGSPSLTSLVVPPGPTVNSGDGYRTVPGETWVTVPGCYAWQVDGLTFSETIVFSAVLPASGAK